MSIQEKVLMRKIKNREKQKLKLVQLKEAEKRQKGNLETPIFIELERVVNSCLFLDEDQQQSIQVKKGIKRLQDNEEESPKSE